MPALTSAELNTLRTHPQRHIFYLSVSKPRVLLTAQVNSAALSRGATSIPYDNGGGSGFADIEAGQTLKVETATGVEYVRIKSISGSQTSGTLTVAANSIVWADNQALTVLEEYRLWPVISRFDSAGNFYKDWDTAYTDENSQPPPVCVAGPHRAGFLSSGSITFSIDLTGSYAIASGASITGYSLNVIPSTGVTVTNTGTGTYDVTITQAGQYWLKAAVTDSNGKSQSTRRRLFVYDASNAPYTELSVSTLSGGWERGGWRLNMSVFGVADETEFADEALVVLWSRTFYGDTETTVGGPAGGENVLFAGYILADSVSKDWNTGEVSFEAGTVDEVLRRRFAYAVSLAAVHNPTDWYEYALWLTPGRAIHHLWRFHSTLFNVADVQGLVDSSLRRKYADMPQADLYQMAARMAESIQARIVCNKAGQLYLARDLQLLDDSSRAAVATIAKLAEQDSIEEMVIGAGEARTALVHVSGLAFDGATVTAYCAKAPGETFTVEGAAVVDVGQQVLADQDHANSLAGRVLARDNNPYPQVRLTFTGGYAGVLDVVPQEWWTIDLAAADNPRGLSWSNQKLICRSCDLRLDNAGGAMTLTATFETEAQGAPGIAVNCITALPDAATRDPGWVEAGPVLRALVAFSDAGSGCYYRDDNDSDWTARNGALTGTDIEDHAGLVDPFWWTAGKQASKNPEQAILFKANSGKLFRSVDAGQNWDEVTPVTDPPNTWSDSPAPTAADLTFTCLTANLFADGTIYALAEWQNAAGAWRGWLLETNDNGLSWTYYEFGTAQDVRPLWMSCAGDSGEVLWVTYWRGDGTLRLQNWATPTMTFTETALGNCTQAEMEAETYTAAPFAPLGDNDLVFVYGRMSAPAGLTGDQHIIKSTDGGSTWASVESGWGSDVCGALYISAESSGNRNYYAVRQ